MESKDEASRKRRYGKSGTKARKRARGDTVSYKRGGRALSSVALPRELVSDSTKTVDLIYVEYVSLGSIVTSAHEFRLNSPYDPYYSGGGHQPRGFDQWAAFYRRYRVTQAKLSFQCADSGATFGVPVVCYIHVGNAVFGVTPPTTVIETPGTVTQLCGALQQPARLTSSVKLWELAGMSYNDYVADDTSSAATNTNPAMILMGSVGVISADAASAPPVWDGVVTLVMRVVFFEKLTPSAS